MGALTHNGEVLQGLPANASQINFDKTGTNLNSTQVENAIKEVNTKVNTNANDIDQLKSGLTNVETVSVIDTGKYKSNNVATVTITSPVITSEQAGWVKISTLPSELRPKSDLLFFAYNNGASSQSNLVGAPLKVKSNGNVEIYFYSGAISVGVNQTFTYVV